MLLGPRRALLKAPATVAAAAYEGPGDIISSGWITWYGLRAFSAATRGDPCCRIKKNTGGAETDINTDATTGIVDVAAIVAHLSGDTGTFLKFYDQATSTHDVEQGVGVPGSDAIAIVPSAFGAHYAGSYGRALSAAVGTTYPQPYTFVGVGQQADADGQAVLFRNDAQIGFCFGGANDTAWLYGGGAGASVAAVDDTPHALIVVFDGASSILRVENTETGSLAGSTFTIASATPFSFPGDSALQYAFEGGAIDGIVGGTERTALAANMMTYYGIS
jgi:hypothetical protein